MKLKKLSKILKANFNLFSFVLFKDKGVYFRNMISHFYLGIPMFKSIPPIEILSLNGVPIELTRKRIKNINLRIGSDGRVKMSVPYKYSNTIIQRFLQEKSVWIFNHLNQMSIPQTPNILEFVEGELHLFLGKSFPLKIFEQSSKPTIRIDDHCLSFFIKESATLEDKKALLQAFYRSQMAALLPDLIKKWEPIIGVQVLESRIKAMKTRWGTCNILKKRIWLNAHLIQKPLHCLEYVLVHEMVHLLEASHNKRFYQLMTQFLPNWKQCKNELATTGTHHFDH